MQQMLNNGVDAIDLAILRSLLDQDGWQLAEVQAELKSAFDLSVDADEIEARINNLRGSGVIKRRSTVLVDPTKLYDHVFLILLKLHLPSTVPGLGTWTWDEAVEAIWRISEEEGEPLRVLFTILGWGDYDLAAIAYVNDLNAYYDFQKRLAAGGLIEKYDTKTLHNYGIPYRFEPINIPSPQQARRDTQQLRAQLDAVTIPRPTTELQG